MTLPWWSLPEAFGALGVAVIAWNFSHGVRLSTYRDMPRAFRTLSALSAFLFLPALVISLLAASAPGVRVLGPLVWLWPLVAVSLTVQAAWALLRGRAGLPVALPIAVFDALVAWVTVVRWLDAIGATVPGWMHAPGIAVSSLAAASMGAWTFPWATALLVPALAPAAPARGRLARTARALVAAGCVACLASVGVAVPGAITLLRAVSGLESGAPSQRARNDLAIGLRLFGPLDGAPSGAVARHDVALSDSLGVTALHVEFEAEGATAAALDSVARSLELRRDSLVLVVTLAFGTSMPTDAALRDRFATIDRIIRRLRPDVLVPAERSDAGPGHPDVAWWKDYYERAAAAARHADRDVTVALASAATTPTDSTLSEWVMKGGTPIDAVAVVARDGGARPARFAAALAAMARWASLARTPPAVWVLGVPSAPLVTGEAGQRSLVRHALTWSATHAWVRGVIVGDASDVSTATALRTADGRSRLALAEVGAMLRAQRDLPPAAPAADSLPPTDSLAVTRRPVADTLLPPAR